MLRNIIVIRNGKIVWKHGPCCWYFRWNLKYLGWSYRACIKTAKKWWLLWGIAQSKWLWGLLLWLWCQGVYNSLWVIICWIAKIYLSFSNSEKWLVTRIPPTFLKNVLKLHRKKSNNWPMVSFIHNGSEITTWMRHSFKTKSAKSRVAFLR